MKSRYSKWIRNGSLNRSRQEAFEGGRRRFDSEALHRILNARVHVEVMLAFDVDALSDHCRDASLQGIDVVADDEVSV
jgi:hypothetical protein